MGLYKPGSRLLNHDFCLVKKIKTGPTIYGFAVDETNSDPYSSVTYIEDAVGFTPATNTNGVFNGGSWLDVFPFNQIKPCRLATDGSLASYLSETDFTKDADGTKPDASDLYRVMIEIPIIYWKFTKTTNGYEVRWSNTKIDDTYQALAHSRGGVIKGNLYIGAYEAYNYTDDTYMYSKTGVVPTVSKSLSTFRTASNGTASGFELMNFHTWTLLQILFVSMFKTLDSQGALGKGLTGGSFIQTGTMDTKGMYYGTQDNETTGVKFMGIENIFGNYLKYVDGICTRKDTGTGYTHELRISDNSVFNDIGDNYAYIIDASDFLSSVGYISNVFGSQLGAFLPIAATSDSDQLYRDEILDNYSDSSNEVNIYRVGGAYNKSNKAGIFAMIDHTINTTSSATTARLQYLAP